MKGLRRDATHSSVLTVEAHSLVAVSRALDELLHLVRVSSVVGDVCVGVTVVGGEGVLLGEVWSEHGHTWKGIDLVRS